MDDLDRKLILTLFEDPRMPLKKLASSVGISRQALNHRMQNLAKAGLFRSLKAEISLSYLDAVVVIIWGRTKATSLDKTLDALGDSEFTSRVIATGGNELIVHGCLRHVSNLSGYVKFIKEVAEMPEVTVGLPSFFDGINPSSYDGGQPRKTRYRKLSPLDLRIIAALRIDSRMPIAEIAARARTSPRTARRHIEIMRHDGSLDYSLPLDVPPGGDMLTVLYITLKRDANAVASSRRLLKIDPIHFILLRQFSNLPGFLHGLVTSDRMTQIREILSMIREDKDVLSVTPNLIYSERTYDSWNCRLLTGRCESPRRTSQS